jgi:hypothetical protein
MVSGIMVVLFIEAVVKWEFRNVLSHGLRTCISGVNLSVRMK